MKGIKVAKFGGTSLADAKQILKVIKIIQADPCRRYVVVSAPGKRNRGDRKITSLLYDLHRGDIADLSSKQIFQIVSDRFYGIVKKLGLRFDPAPYLDTIWYATGRGVNPDFLVSRGEFLIARILALALDYKFVDAVNVIQFNSHGQFDMEATRQHRSQLTKRARGYVIPGFYGSLPDGKVKTFTRGGSDVSGAIIAALVGAELYENWTDVSGILMADPEMVPNARKIDVLTYGELRELTYRGARVLHEEVIFPLRKAGIPIRIRNTNRPNDEGTLIVPNTQAPQRKSGSIVGIAGRKDLTVITVEKTKEVGFLRRVCAVLEKNAVGIEHITSSIDTISVVVESETLEGKLNLIKTEIEQECKPDNITISHDLALICTVGHAMVHAPGVAARLFQAVASAGINIRTIGQGESELSIIIGIENDEYESAIRAIYGAFVK